MKKRLLSLFVCLVYSMAAFSTVYASKKAPATEKDNKLDGLIALMIDSNTCVVNGETKSVGDVNPTIVQSRTLVPVRFLAESLGGDVTWNDSTKTASLQVEGKQIDVPIGESHIVVDGEKTELDVGGTLLNNRTMLPLRGICEAMGKDVSYDDGMILISEKDFNDRADDENDDFRKQLLRYQLTEGKVIKPAGETTGIKAIADRSECILVKSTDLPYSKADGTCYISRGGMNIVNMKAHMKDTQTFSFDFDVYNQRCSYGIVEVYDVEGALISTRFILPYEGAMTTSVRTWFKNAWTDIPASFRAIYEYASGNSSYVDYKTQANTTHINIDVPKDGYMLFTANPNHSALVEKRNTILTISKMITTVISASGAYKDITGSVSSSTIQEIVSSEVEKYFAEKSEAYINIADSLLHAFDSNPITATGYNDAASGIMDAVYEACNSAAPDLISNCIQGTAVTLLDMQGKKLSLDFKENLPLVGQVFAGMDFMANGFNTIYALMDINESQYLSSVVFICRDTPSIESSNIMVHNNKKYTSGAEFPGLASIKELMNRYIGSEYVIYNDKIYYSWVSDNKGNWDSELYSCNLDGSDAKLIFSDDSSGASRFIVTDKRIYFTSIKKYLDLETNITFDLTELLHKNEVLFYAKGSTVYGYKKSGGGIDIIRTDVDTGQREVITTRGNQIDKCIETADGKIYYLEIEWLEGAWLYQVKDGVSQLVQSFNKEFESLEAIVDGVIYYTGDTGSTVYLSYYDLNTQAGGQIAQREYKAGGASFY